jgi:hypothetical protein
MKLVVTARRFWSPVPPARAARPAFVRNPEHAGLLLALGAADIAGAPAL